MLEDLLETLREDPWESVDEEAVLAMQAALAAEEANRKRTRIQKQVHTDHPDEPQKKLKRQLRQEALARLEDAARTPREFQEVLHHWDTLDANRERRERYHEVLRNDQVLSLDYDAARDGRYFPNSLNAALAKQLREGEFLDTIFDCPFEIQELVSDDDLAKILQDLKDEHKEILFFDAVWQYSAAQIARMRDQSDRNIRKVRNTVLRKISKKLLPVLTEREQNQVPMTQEERRFLAKLREENGGSP
jgi:hypothetical protein